MRYKFERFPTLTHEQECFTVALKAVRFEDGFTKATISFNLFPKWNDGKLHPVAAFLVDHTNVVPRYTTYLDVSHAAEFLWYEANFSHQKQRAVVELTGNLFSVNDMSLYNEVDPSSFEEFKRSINLDYTNFTAYHFHVPEDM